MPLARFPLRFQMKDPAPEMKQSGECLNIPVSASGTVSIVWEQY